MTKRVLVFSSLAVAFAFSVVSPSMAAAPVPGSSASPIPAPSVSARPLPLTIKECWEKCIANCKQEDAGKEKTQYCSGTVAKCVCPGLILPR